MKKILFLLFVCIAISTSAQTITWTGLVDNNFNNMDNWNPLQVPMAINDVVIPTGSTMTVNTAATILSIDIQGTAIVTISSNLTFTAPSIVSADAIVTWTSGSLSGGSTLTNYGIFNLTTGSSKHIIGSTIFNNEGTFNIDSGGDLLISDGIFNNQLAGVIDLRADAGNISYSGGLSRILNNYGLIKRSTSAGNADIHVYINNLGGTISVESGVLTFNFLAKTLTDGTYNVALGSTLNWSVAIEISGILTGTLDGTLNWSTNVTAATTATFDFTGSNGLKWNSGSLLGGGTVTNKGVLDLISNSSHTIAGVTPTTFNNEGTVNITNGGDLLITNAIFNNQLTGTIDMQADAGNISYSGALSRILNNYGNIKRTTSLGNADIHVNLNNLGGAINVESGSLTFNFLEKSFTDGSYNIAAGSTLTWGVNIIFAGTMQGLNDGDINWNSTVTIPNATVVNFEFTGAGNLNWRQSNLIGGGTLELKNPVNLTTNASKTILGFTTLNNNSTINITSGGDIVITDGVINNQANGVIDMQADGGNITYSGAASRILNNYGLIKRTTTSGVASIRCFLNNNDGTINIESGELTFDFLDKNLNDGNYNVVAGSKLTWGVNIIFTGTMQGLNDGDINWNSTVTIPNATVVNFEFTGAGNLNWRQSNLIGGGTLELKNSINLTTNASKTILGLTTLNNESTMNITSGGDLVITDGVLNNQVTGVIDMQADGGNITYSGSASRILNNYGIIKKTTSGGTASIRCFLNNFDGTINIESGDLTFDFLEKNLTDGNLNVVPGSNLNWNSTTTVAGTLQGTLDGNINWSANVNVPVTTTATFDFSGAGDINWTTSNLSGGGTLVNKSLINLTTTATKNITGLTTLNNESNLNITSTGNLNINDGIFNNQATGVIDLQVDAGNISYIGSASRILNNFGLIKKSAGAGVVQIFVQTNNSGTIDIMSGELQVDDPLGLVNTATGIIKGVGVFDIPSPANYTNDGTFAPGASPGTLDFIGDYESTASSVLDIELDGTVQGTEYDLLTISSDAIMDGIVNVTMGYDGVLGEEFIVAATSGLITSCTLAPTATSDYNGKQYDFSVMCRNDNEVVLTIILITDIQNPTAIAQNIIAPLDATGIATITADDINNGSNDNCTIPGNLILSIDISSWNCYELGDHTVTLTVEDEEGLMDTTTAVVTVVAPITTFTAGAWAPNAPHLGSTAVVNDIYETSTDGIIDSCLCEVTTLGTLNVNAGTYVRSARHITVDGNLNVEPEGSIVQIDDLANATNNGNISVQMTTPTMAAKSFMVVGSPMTNESRAGVYSAGYIVRNHITANFVPHPLVEVVSPGINNWADDNGDNWVTYNSSINPGEGYIVFPQPNGTSSGIYTHTHTQGTLNNGLVSFPLGYNGTQNGSPNILSNPYASAIDAEVFFDDASNSNIDVIYFWEHNTAASPAYPGYNANNFSMLDISMYVEGVGGNPAASGGATPGQYIASGQGFGVKPVAGGTAVFNNSMRVIDNNNSYRTNNNPSRDRLWLNVFNDTYQLGSTALIAFTENSSDTYINSEDVKRLATPVSLYSELETGEELAVNTLETFDVEDAIYLSFTTQVKETQSYRFSILEKDGLNMENASIFLIDNLTGVVTDLTLNEYSFTSNEAVNQKRFKVVFKNSPLGIDDSSIDSISVYPNPTQGIINIVSPNLLITHAQIYDIGGRMVSEISFTKQGNYQLDISNLESAMYMVQIFSENESIVKRLVKQ